MEPVVITKSGTLRGFVDGGAAVFLGVPYAAPPFGDRRFRRPVPAGGWDGTRDALAYGASAPQAHRQFTLIPEPVIDGDDCLNLNVFTPDPGAAGLPVLFWIHGGGFVAGSSASPWYRGQAFGRDGVVVVTINYRLGIEGFLPLDGAPTNRALHDWTLALEWVQDNIAAFGGDPTQVTIAGQSAGGAACAALLASPQARGLFRSAILMSGVGLQSQQLDSARAFADKVASGLGVRATQADFAAIAPAALVEAQNDRMSFAPLVDGDSLPTTVYDAVKAGVSGDIPVMLGTTAEEGVAALRLAADRINEGVIRDRLEKEGLSPDGIARFFAAHAGEEPWRMLGHGVTEARFRVQALRFAEARADAAGAGTWLYDFRWKTKVRDMGAVHCLDVPFAFDVLDGDGVREVAGDAPPQSLADEVHGSWVRFITSGEPGPGWPRYDTSTRQTKVFDAVSSVVSDPWEALRSVWDA
jgi:para-nitrobenzyl esterase